MKFTSSQPSRVHCNSTIIYFYQREQNLTQFVKVLLVKLSEMLHSSNFVRLFHRKSFTLYGSRVWSSYDVYMHPQRANIPLQGLAKRTLTVGPISGPHSQLRTLLWRHFTSHGFTWSAKSIQGKQTSQH